MLPSGKTIEVVYFEEADELVTGVQPARPSPRPSRARTSTSASTATPASSTRSSGRRPGPRTGASCSTAPTASGLREGVFTQDTVESFDEELDGGADALARDYRRLMRANMVEEIDRFVAALDAERTSCPRTSRRRASGVALDHAVRDEVERTAAGVSASSRSLIAAFASATWCSACSRASDSAPVSAIRSQTAAACAGSVTTERRSRSRSSGSRRAGQDQRQRHRAVEQVRPARLAGARRSAPRRRARRRAAGRPGRRSAPKRASASSLPGASPNSAPRRQAASNRLAVFSRQRSR